MLEMSVDLVSTFEGVNQQVLQLSNVLRLPADAFDGAANAFGSFQALKTKHAHSEIPFCRPNCMNLLVIIY